MAGVKGRIYFVKTVVSNYLSITEVGDYFSRWEGSGGVYLSEKQSRTSVDLSVPESHHPGRGGCVHGRTERALRVHAAPHVVASDERSVALELVLTLVATCKVCSSASFTRKCLTGNNTTQELDGQQFHQKLKPGPMGKM